MESYRTFVKNNIIVLIGHILICMKGIILIPVLVKLVGVTVYGGYVLIGSILSLVLGISSLGVSFRCNRSMPSETDRKVRQELFYPQFSFQLFSLLLLSFAIIVCFPFVDNIFLKGEVVFSKWLIIPFFITHLIYIQSTDYFRYTHRINFFTYATALYPYFNIAIILLIYFKTHNLNVNTILSAEIFSAFLVASPLLIKLVREIGLNINLPYFKDLIADIKLGFPLILGFIVDIILSSSDRYIIAAMISVTAVGYYAPAYALGSLIAFFPKVSGVVLPPLMSKTVDSGKEDEAGTMLNYTIEGFFLLAIPFIIGSTVLSKPLLSLLANREVAQNAYMVTPIVALGTLFYGLNLILSNVLFVRMKTAIMFNMNVLAAVINLVVNLILLYVFKNIAIAAATTFLSYFIAFIYIRRAVLNYWHVTFPFKLITKSMMASLVMGACLIGINFKLETHSDKPAFVIGEIILGIIIYSAVLLMLKTFSQKEINYLKRVFS